jgi:serine protease Do
MFARAQLAVIVLSALCAGAVSGCDRFPPPWARKPAPAKQAPPPDPLPHPALTTLGGQATVADVVERALPSVVSIASTRSSRPHAGFMDDPWLRRFFGPQSPHGESGPRVERGLGSGVIISKDGVVVTSSHVVEEAAKIVVTAPDGTQYDAKLVGTDPKSDLAVIRIEGDAGDLAPIEIGDASRLRLGDVVLAIGNPFGVGQTVTMGIVSAQGRANLGIVDYEDFIQTDAAINPGNSGGALVNMEGKLVGINTAILSRHGGYMGIGFAIPTSMVTPITKALLEHGKVVRGWLGIAIQDIDRDLAEAMGLPGRDGVLVGDVQPASPAAKAGLRRGDVILTIDGKPVEDSAKLKNTVAALGASAVVRVEILRAGRKQVLTVKLNEVPEDSPSGSEAPEAQPSPPPGQPLGGVTVEPLTPEFRAHLKLPPDITEGVVVTDMVANSPAARGGMRPGDVVLEIDRTRVTSVADFERLWKAAKGETLVLVARQGRTLFLAVER